VLGSHGRRHENSSTDIGAIVNHLDRCGTARARTFSDPVAVNGDAYADVVPFVVAPCLKAIDIASAARAAVWALVNEGRANEDASAAARAFVDVRVRCELSQGCNGCLVKQHKAAHAPPSVKPLDPYQL